MTIASSSGRVSVSESPKSLSTAKWRFVSRLARKRTSMRSSVSCTASTLLNSVGTTTTVRNSGGMPARPSSSSFGRILGGSSDVMNWCTAPMAIEFAGMKANSSTSRLMSTSASQNTAARAASVQRRTPPMNTTFGWRSAQRCSASRGFGS